MNNSVIEILKKVIYGQRLNLLIGSGASMPAIKLMKDFENTEDGNAKLLKNIVGVSRTLISQCSRKRSEEVNRTLANYTKVLSSFIEILLASNSRVKPRVLNIFSTNYDLFIEKTVDEMMNSGLEFIFNDGANGYFSRKLDSHNFDNSVSYRGQFENHTDEIPTLKLIKPHGSVNWKRCRDDQLYIYPSVQDDPFVVLPDGSEARQTFESNHFFDMLRTFQLELAKSDSVLITIGFSFGDQHIAKLVKRALNSPDFMAFIVCYNHDDLVKIENSLIGQRTRPSNLFFVEPGNLNLSSDLDTKDSDKHMNQLAEITMKEFSDLIAELSRGVNIIDD